MAFLTITNPKLSSLGDELIKKIKARKNCFDTMVVAVPSIRTEQWFKSYWLQHEDTVLMNVDFKLVDDVLLSMINNGSVKFDLLTKHNLTMLILMELSNNPIYLSNEIKTYLQPTDQNYQIKLYDISCTLANLFIEYDIENFSIPSSSQLGSFEKKLYYNVISAAKNHNMGTLRSIFDDFRQQSNQFPKVADALCFFGFSTISAIQKKIIDDYSNMYNTTLYFLSKSSESNQSCTPQIIQAPSKIREIESLHGDICSKLKYPAVKYSDFLVLAPDISEYETIINRVFKQTDSRFPNIPFSINDRKRAKTDVGALIETLLKIRMNKCFTRLDFSKIITIPAVQRACGITKEDVKAIINTIIQTNVYGGSEDWEYIKNRMLLSKLVGTEADALQTVRLSSGEYTPYSSIELTDEITEKFIRLIDKLQDWLNIKGTNIYNCISNIESSLDAFLSYKNQYGEEKNYRYRKITKIISFYKEKASTLSDLIPVETFLYFLIDASAITHANCGEFFTKGITFADFDENAIIAAKYIYFINLSSSVFPKKLVKSELDLRPDAIDKKLCRIKEGFALQSNNATDLQISYLYINLKTEETYFLSSLVPGSFGPGTQLPTIPIDENTQRSWDMLFTKREFRNKDYFDGLTTGPVAQNQNSIPSTITNAKKVRAKDMADFISNPLKQAAKHSFGWNDDTSKKLQDEYEPFSLDNLSESKLIKKTLIDYYPNPFDELDFKNNATARHLLPDITLTHFDTVVANIKDKYDKIKNDSSGATLTYINDVILNNDVILSCNDPVLLKTDPNGLTFYQLKPLKDDKNENKIEYSFLYIASLMYISSMLSNNQQIHCSLVRYNNHICCFDVSPTNAKTLLNGINDFMNDYDKIAYFPTNDFLNGTNISQNDLFVKLERDTIFTDKKMFNEDYQLGYNKTNDPNYDENAFTNEFTGLQQRLKQLIIF